MAIKDTTTINYTGYYNILEYFRTVLSNHPSVKTVTQGDVFGIDDKSFPEYPLANIFIESTIWEGSRTIWRCKLTVADKVKLRNNESEGQYDKMSEDYWGTDDMSDIHANSLAIINDIISFTAKGTSGFFINGIVISQPFREKFDNGLAGWVTEFEVLTHNDRNICLFELL